MEKIQLKYLPMALLLTYLTKALIVNTASLSDVLIIAVLAGLTAFYELQMSTKVVKEITLQMKELHDRSDKQDKIIDDMRNSVASVKITSGFRAK